MTLIDARLCSGIWNSHRAPGFGEPLGQSDLELCDLMGYWRDPGNDVTGQQAHSELVRIMQNDRVIDGQAKRRDGRHSRSQWALNLRWLHPADLLTVDASDTGRATAQQAGKDLAGDVALEAAQDLFLGLALGGASGYVVLGGLVAVHADQGDAPQGAV